MCCQWVVQLRPSRMPAAPSVKAPEHTDMTQAPRSTASRSTFTTAGDGVRAAEEAGTAIEVGVGRGLEAERCGDGGAVAGVERRRGLGADPVVEGGHALLGAVDAEHLGEHPELEQGHGLLEEHGDGLQCHADQYGR